MTKVRILPKWEGLLGRRAETLPGPWLFRVRSRSWMETKVIFIETGHFGAHHRPSQ